MMDKLELYELMERFEKSGLEGLKLRDGDFSLELRKSAPAPAFTVSPAPTAAVPAAPAEAVQAAPAAPAGEVVRAPLVGTYYAAPTPGAEPFVRVGDRVEKGATLCLIEAMKTMSEIPAPCDLVVEELLAEDGALVGFDAPLVRYRHV